MTVTPRTISVLGSTGSIGTQTLDVLDRLGPSYRLRWITCNTKWELLAEQTRTAKPYGVAIRDTEACAAFTAQSGFSGPILCGDAGLAEAAADSENDVVMSAMVGFSGVVPTLHAIRAGHIVALANKETLVSAGELMMSAVHKHGAQLIAVDSEHSAILQCLAGERTSDVSRLVITASGGPFRTTPAEQLQHMTAAQALKHPNWSMGSKITIDSATLMNKGFEVIEARWLFNLDADRIDVVVHPQSIIHSMVEFVDGSVKAQMGLPSMLGPIHYALTFPHREPLTIPALNLAELGELTFEPPDRSRFPCLQLAYDALVAGGSAGCVVNAANEVAVQAFLEGRITFTRIPTMISETLVHIEHVAHPSLDTILQIDAEARAFASSLVR